LEPGIEQTSLVGEIRGQSHLYGVLDLVRGLELGLVSVETNWVASERGDEEMNRSAASSRSEVGRGGQHPQDRKLPVIQWSEQPLLPVARRLGALFLGQPCGDQRAWQDLGLTTWVNRQP
jgi:hypothetical protein